MPRLHARKKRRLVYFLLGVVAVAFLFFSPESRFSLRCRDALYRVVTPVSLFWRRSFQRVAGLYGDYLHLVGVQRENGQLKQELVRLESENIRLREALAESGGSGATPASGPVTVARVVGYDPASPRQSLIVDKGELEGIRPDDVVLAEGALVGRVLKVTPRFSQVLLLTDPDHAVGVVDQGSRAKGILVGWKRDLGLSREPWLTKTEYFRGAEEIHAGDLLLTSGVDGVFPKGIPVGNVRRVEKDESGLFWQAEVEPRVEVTKLEYVQILPGVRGGREDG
jgi:rod shape-determining protein MreC